MLNKKRWQYYFIITLIMAMPLFSYDIYLPAFKSIEIYYNTQISHVQQTLSLYLIGCGVSQLIFGFSAKKFGYKFSLLIGIFIYIIATTACLFSPSINYFTIFRFLQGVGACSGAVIGRAIAIEVFKKEIIRAFNFIFPLVTLSTAIAPPLGGILVKYFNSWCVVFIMLLFFGILVFFLILNIIPLNLSKESDNKTATGRIFYNIIRKNEFWGYSAMFIGIYQIWFIYVIESPYIFFHLGLASEEVGLMYVPTTVACFVGNFIVHAMLKRISPTKSIQIGLIGVAIAELAYIVLILFLNYITAFSILLPMIFIIISSAALAPVGTAQALSLFPTHASYASAIIGLVQFTLAGTLTLLLVSLTKDPAATLAYSIFLILIVMFICYKFLILKRKSGIGVSILESN